MAAPANAPIPVEVAVDSVAGAQAAERAGAARVELCSALLEGGLTPSLGLLAAVREAVTIPVFAMIRPRGGDFLYSAAEFDVMTRDARIAIDHGAGGVVTGVLAADGELDRERMARLRDIAIERPMTCHRAFDLVEDPFAALATLEELGIDRVLTSGQAASAPAGSDRIAQIVEAAGDGVRVMAGAGVRAENAAELARATGCHELHLSATGWQPSAMRYRRDGVPMGTATPPDEYTLRQTDGEVVAAVVRALAAVAGPTDPD